jgi:hypothetical protein
VAVAIAIAGMTVAVATAVVAALWWVGAVVVAVAVAVARVVAVAVAVVVAVINNHVSPFLVCIIYKKCLIIKNKDLNIYNCVPTIHKQPAEPHIANDTDSNCSILFILLMTLTLTFL